MAIRTAPASFTVVAALISSLAAPAAARPAWTGSRVSGTPEPPPPYRTERAFPRLGFDRPVELVPVPGAGRLAVAQLKGKIVSFPDRADVATADVLCDLASGRPKVDSLLGMAFHPAYPRRPYLYVMYLVEPRTPKGSRVSRLRVLPGDPPRCDPRSETILLDWYGGGHNGGSLQFGPDGYLYVSAGDGADPFPPDSFDTGQRLDDLLGSILRIDVDHPSPGRPYGIPRDNPFQTTKGARPEIFAYGFRNPWRISVDAVTGEVWTGDVGWETWEMVHRVRRGGNYGWSIQEGPLVVRPDARRGPTPILPPVVVHGHDEASSITGGRIYRGRAHADLRGAYVYADFETGKVWALRDAAKPTPREIADTRHNVVAIGADAAGELVLLDYGGNTFSSEFATGTLHRLVPHAGAEANRAFPRRLAETGLFASTRAHRYAPGVVEYRINAAPWADGATARRAIALPGTSRVVPWTRETARGPTPPVPPPFVYPDGAVLARTFFLPRGRARRPVETQLLHLDGDEWRGYSYRWDDRGADATLVPAAGEEARITVAGPGGPRTVRWRFGSRAECATCHNLWAGPVLGFVPAQLAGPRGELARLRAAGVLDQPPSPAQALVDPYDRAAAPEPAARSYLHVNCSPCHRPGAGGSVALALTFDVPLAKTATVDARPLQGTFGIEDGKVIAPGDPFRSVLFYRLATTGGGRMPRLGPRTVDDAGLETLERWIASLPGGRSSSAPSASIDERLGTTSGALRLARDVSARRLPAADAHAAVARGAHHARREVSGLFERFLPEGERKERLGDTIDRSRLLALSGDAARGRALFLSGAGACLTCHRAAGQGGTLGPDLGGVGARLPREQILDSILQPSAQIDPRYAWYVAETSGGETHAGILAERTKDAVVLVDAANTRTRIPAAQLRRLIPEAKSAMPEALLSTLTADEAADLLAFLASLR